MTKTIVFVHGMFQNAISWAKWVNFFEAKGYTCVAPSWPLHEGEPATLRQNPPAGLGELSLDEIVTKIENVVLEQSEKPIVIGHSVGGLIVQLLSNKNLIAAGVAVDSVAPNAMLSFDWGFFKNSAMIANPLKGDQPFLMDEEGFHGSFANSLSMEDSNIAYSKFATHDSRNVLRDCMGSSGKVDLELPHAPLLFIGGEKDQIIPPELNEKNAKAYTDEDSTTSFKEFHGRSHFICGEPAWEEVAAYSYEWLEANVK